VIHSTANRLPNEGGQNCRW